MANLVYRFGVEGVQNVHRAIDGISARFRKAASQNERTAASSAQKMAAEQERTAIKGLASIGKLARQIDYKNHVAKLREIDAQAKAEEKAVERANKAAMRAIEKERRARQEMMRGVGNSIAGAGSRAFGTLTRGAGLAAGLVGGISVANAISQGIDKDTAARALANKAAPLEGETRSREEIRKSVMANAESEAVRTGNDSVTQLQSMDKFIERAGDFQAAEKLQKQINDLGDAMGMSKEGMVQLYDVAGTFYSSFKAQGLNLNQAVEATANSLKAASKIGLEGQIGPEELAAGLGKKLIAGAVSMGGSPEQVSKNFAMLAGAANLSMAVGGSSSAEEAGTAAMRFVSDLYKHGKALNKKGIDVYDKQGNLKSLDQLIPAIIKGTGGQMSQVEDILGERGIKLASGYAAHYRSLPKEQREAYLSQVQKDVASNTYKTLSDQDIQQGAAFNRQGAEKQIGMSMEEFNKAISTDLLPILVHDLIPAFKELAPYIKEAAHLFAQYLKFLAENPFIGLGGTFVALLTKELVGAGIGMAVKGVLMSMLGVEGAGMGLPAGAGAALGGAGKFLGAAGLAAGAVYMAYDQNEQLKKETGGMGIFDIMGGMWDQGTWDPAKVVNKHLDDQAKEAASHGGSNKPPITEATGTNLSNAAKDMKDAAKAMKDAAAKLRPMTAPIGSR